MAASVVGRNRVPVDALLAAAVPTLPRRLSLARLVGDDEAFMAARGPVAGELGCGAGLDPHAGCARTRGQRLPNLRASRAASAAKEWVEGIESDCSVERSPCRCTRARVGD